ncbi:adenosylcobalamin-dependent ribonucleoside-diphosphate reductase [Arthrospiribacter ruber]|uniref:Vitamin B12-dependent ribonucleotide reductase n=1 Tax=Arthrospiribacter ruber TaxID=2487934 RepID=A0A951ME88_9BACT|nr:adenosylcobalamin-dependent ribonucleoside-diphosphate reductase [Arthrospiribacter ruber]MBW3469539.1 adenosylcobalamin-dependent ribonucleoside-diphosphate reductase [Arthrospiribacter ruber]
MQEITDKAHTLLKSRYLLEDVKSHSLESPEQMFSRVAVAVGNAEKNYRTHQSKSFWEGRFFELMRNYLFLPNSTTLINAGKPFQQLCACFVLPVSDDKAAMDECMRVSAMIQENSGGTGYDLSGLNPRGETTLKGESYKGPIDFIRQIDSLTEIIMKPGRRKGANMGALHVSHPDIEEFVNAKVSGSDFQNFNISVGITDEFMQAMFQDKVFELIHPESGEVIRKIPAKYLWKSIVRQAWWNGDPGILFLDEINRHNPTPSLGRITGTNPCGEVPLLPYEACNLGSLNLAKMVALPFSKSSFINWKKLGETVNTAIRFLDNVIDVNNYPIPQIEFMAKGNRKVGLGVMGWADMLIRLGIPYTSNEAIELASKIMKFIKEKSWNASFDLALEREPFPNWEKSIYYPMQPLRNATCTAIAPTGSISFLAEVSPSIEPLFTLNNRQEYQLKNQTPQSLNPALESILTSRGLYSKGIIDRICAEGKLKNIPGLPEDLKELFKTAQEVPFQIHLKHQLAFQNHTDNAISKTINLPESATMTEVDWAFKMAWYGGAKGVTVYRNRSKEHQPFESIDGQIVHEQCFCNDSLLYLNSIHARLKKLLT